MVEVLLYREEVMSDRMGMLMESSENGTDLSQDDTGTIEDTPQHPILLQQTSVNLVPFIGQRFISQDAAYEFYCSFAKQNCFSIRRHRTRGKDGVGRGVTRRDFTCHRGGYPQMKPSEDGKMQRNRKSSRCGCQAYMRIVKRADFDVPEWRVTGFNNVHNHELMKVTQVRLLPAYCAITPDEKARICMFSKAGMSVRQMLRLMELEKGVKVGCLPFTEIDVRNLLQSFRSVGRDYDAIDLVGMCKKLKDENPCFQYDFKIDGHNRLEHIAWSYASSIQSYNAFGDAVVFDTTHRVDAYDMLLGIWVGVDNHGLASFFSCVLLRDENMQSFSWALRKFMGFMKGKAPLTLLTDENMWLKEAIALEMPKTKHAFCIWHIIGKFSDWFSVLLGSRYDNWKADFYRLYNMELVDDFEDEWREVVNRYGLEENRHVISLYALRPFWAFPFLRHHFFAGLMSSSQSEAINAFIQRVLSAQSQLDCFVEHLSETVQFGDRNGSKQKIQRKLQKVCLRTGSPIECHAITVLTPYAFCKLQDELLSAPQYSSILIDDGCFEIKHHTHVDGGHKVIWVPCEEHIRCSCYRFEFSGILCRHILRVLSNNNCFHIPEQYLPPRWRIDCLSSTNQLKNPSREQAEKIKLLESMASALVEESVETEERLNVACEQMATVLSHVKELPRLSTGEINYNCASNTLIMADGEDVDGIVQSFMTGTSHESLVLGKLKERRMRNGVDCMSRKRRQYSGPCVPFEEDPSDCELMGGDNLNGDTLGYL